MLEHLNTECIIHRIQHQIRDIVLSHSVKDGSAFGIGETIFVI